MHIYRQISQPAGCKERSCPDLKSQSLLKVLLADLQRFLKQPRLEGDGRDRFFLLCVLRGMVNDGYIPQRFLAQFKETLGFVGLSKV